MLLKREKGYRFTVQFHPPLTEMGQFQDLNRKTYVDQTALLGLTPKAAVILKAFDQDTNELSVGKGWFKVGRGKGPFSMAVITKIDPEKVFLK